MSTVAGVDGCKAGWFVVLRGTDTGRLWWRVAYDFATVLDIAHGACALAVDMPIGLPDAAVHGGRQCDREARQLLKGIRMSSVFPTPVRAAIRCQTDQQAQQANLSSSPENIGIPIPCLRILPKIRELDDIMTPELQVTVKEIHPELCFYALNGGKAIQLPKRSVEGRAARLALLRKQGYGPLADAALGALPRGVEPDDILDACAACWTAGRMAEGTATRIPTSPPRDSRGLRMEMWL